jgi:hypothetical protein
VSSVPLQGSVVIIRINCGFDPLHVFLRFADAQKIKWGKTDTLSVGQSGLNYLIHSPQQSFSVNQRWWRQRSGPMPETVSTAWFPRKSAFISHAKISLTARKIRPDQYIQAHTILKTKTGKYADKPVLVLGGKLDNVRKVAERQVVRCLGEIFVMIL